MHVICGNVLFYVFPFVTRVDFVVYHFVVKETSQEYV